MGIQTPQIILNQTAIAIATIAANATPSTINKATMLQNTTGFLMQS